jgi:hypothetical protein
MAQSGRRPASETRRKFGARCYGNSEIDRLWKSAICPFPASADYSLKFGPNFANPLYRVFRCRQPAIEFFPYNIQPHSQHVLTTQRNSSPPRPDCNSRNFGFSEIAREVPVMQLRGSQRPPIVDACGVHGSGSVTARLDGLCSRSAGHRSFSDPERQRIRAGIGVIRRRYQVVMEFVPAVAISLLA